MNVAQAHIAELRRQVQSLMLENAVLKSKLAAWPAKATEHALAARARERARLLKEKCEYCGHTAEEAL